MNERLERVVAAQIARAARKYGPAELFVQRADGQRLSIIAAGRDESTEPETVGNATVYRFRRSFAVSASTWRAVLDFIGGDSAFRDGEIFVERDGGAETKFRPDVPAAVERFGGGLGRRIFCVKIEENN